MNDSQKIRLLETICERHPNTRINNAMWQVKRAERREELSRSAPHPRGVVAMIRKLTGRA